MATTPAGVRVALVGCGGMGGSYRSALENMKGRFRVTACVDLDLARAEGMAKTLGAERAANLERGVVSEEEMRGMDPLHAVYAYAQNKLSAIVEDVAQLPMCAELADAYSSAEEEYLPSGPPMSPLTRSYFFCWAVFDSHVGEDRETFATVAIDLCRRLGNVQIVGVDWTRGMVAHTPDGGNNVHYLAMDAARLGFPDNSFDVVCLVRALHHMTDATQAQVLAEMVRVLKPDGRCFVAEMYRDGQSETQMTDVLIHHWIAAVDTAIQRVA